MKITIEDTIIDKKQKIALEYSDDNPPIDETFDMIIRLLYAYGYKNGAVIEYIIECADGIRKPGEGVVPEAKS